MTEEFTRKTCGDCGHIDSNLGGSKLFKCPKCGHWMLRDFNGAMLITNKIEIKLPKQ